MMERWNMYSYNNQQIMIELGKSVQRKRLNLNMQQSQLAERCGVSLSTIIALEKGRNVTLDTLIAVLRELRELDALYTLFLTPEPISPRLLYLEGKTRRQRARQPKRESL